MVKLNIDNDYWLCRSILLKTKSTQTNPALPNNPSQKISIWQDDWACSLAGMYLGLRPTIIKKWNVFMFPDKTAHFYHKGVHIKYWTTWNEREQRPRKPCLLPHKGNEELTTVIISALSVKMNHRLGPTRQLGGYRHFHLAWPHDHMEERTDSLVLSFGLTLTQ